MNRSLCAAVLVMVLGLEVFGRERFTELGDGGGPVSISWESLGAEYRVEMRRDGQIFITTRQQESELSLNLAPGLYEYRISVLDPFGGVVSSSEWRELEVQHPKIPYFRVNNPVEAREGDGEIELELTGAVMERGIVFELAGENRRIPLIPVKEGEGVKFLIDTALLVPGIWDMKASMPSGLSFTYPGVLNLRPARRPRFESAEITQVLGTGFVLAVLKGDNFDEEMKVQVECAVGKARVMAVDVPDTHTALVYLDLADAASGNCGITITNPSGEQERREDAVTLPEFDAGEMIRPEFRSSLGFRAGYTPMVSLIPNTDSADGVIIRAVPAWAALEAAVIFHSGWKRPFVRGLGMEARVVTGGIGPRETDENLDAFGMIDLSVSWRPKVQGRLEPVFITGIGNMWDVKAANQGSENLLFFRVGSALNFIRGRHRFHIGLESAFVLDNRRVFTMAGLSAGWGMQF